MDGHVGEGTRIQQESTPRFNDLCDIIETRSVAHSVLPVKGQQCAK